MGCVYAILFGSVFIFSIALLCTHTVLEEMIASRMGVQLQKDMFFTTCTLENFQPLTLAETQYMPYWTGQVNELLAGIIVHPLDIYQTLKRAEAIQFSWPLNQSYTCICPSNFKPRPLRFQPITNMCMLQESVVAYLNQEMQRYKYAGDALIGVGIVSLLFSLTGLAVFGYEYYAKRQQQMQYDNEDPLMKK